jgi:hypothetical protein
MTHSNLNDVQYQKQFEIERREREGLPRTPEEALQQLQQVAASIPAGEPQNRSDICEKKMPVSSTTEIRFVWWSSTDSRRETWGLYHEIVEDNFEEILFFGDNETFVEKIQEDMLTQRIMFLGNTRVYWRDTSHPEVTLHEHIHPDEQQYAFKVAFVLQVKNMGRKKFLHVEMQCYSLHPQ